MNNNEVPDISNNNDSEKPYKGESENKENMKTEIARLAREIIESGEALPFPGMTQEAKETIEADQEVYLATTPIGELITRFENTGMKIVMGPNDQNIFILPNDSDDVENDSIRPKHLDISGANNELLSKLIELSQGYKKAE